MSSIPHISANSCRQNDYDSLMTILKSFIKAEIIQCQTLKY